METNAFRFFRPRMIRGDIRTTMTCVKRRHPIVTATLLDFWQTWRADDDNDFCSTSSSPPPPPPHPFFLFPFPLSEWLHPEDYAPMGIMPWSYTSVVFLSCGHTDEIVSVRQFARNDDYHLLKTTTTTAATTAATTTNKDDNSNDIRTRCSIFKKVNFTWYGQTARQTDR